MEDEVEMYHDVQPDVLDEIARSDRHIGQQARELILQDILERDPYVRFVDGQPV